MPTQFEGNWGAGTQVLNRSGSFYTDSNSSISDSSVEGQRQNLEQM